MCKPIHLVRIKPSGRGYLIIELYRTVDNRVLATRRVEKVYVDGRQVTTVMETGFKTVWFRGNTAYIETEAKQKHERKRRKTRRKRRRKKKK